MKTLCLVMLGLSVLLAGCDPAPSQKTASVAPPTEYTNRPSHFWFNYPYDPSPGKRYWTCVGETWIEQYESGEYSRFRVAGRSSVDNTAGTVAVKFAGEQEKTWTGNEENFQVFIPDRGAPKMQLWFRHKQNGKWEEWRNLADLEGVE